MHVQESGSLQQPIRSHNDYREITCLNPNVVKKVISIYKRIANEALLTRKTHDKTQNQMFGAVHFIYCINSSIATKVDSTYVGYLTTAHNVYVFGDRWARTSDIEITSPTLTRHCHTSRHHMLSSSTLD